MGGADAAPQFRSTALPAEAVPQFRSCGATDSTAASAAETDGGADVLPEHGWTPPPVYRQHNNYFPPSDAETNAEGETGAP
jgi:hypothetical protein